jgi:two-component system OmpR family sensor kinase
MDGGTGRVSFSLQYSLNRWIISATAVFALLASAISGWIAFDEAREIQDNLLMQVASLAVSPPSRPGSMSHDDKDPEDAVVWQPLHDNGKHPLSLPGNIPDGFHTIKIEDVGWRIFVYPGKGQVNESVERFVVAQQTEARDEIAWNSSLRTLLPVLLLAPILMAVVRFAVSRSLQPVHDLATEVNRRDGTSPGILPNEGVPREIRPFITSINRLLRRLEQGITQQRRFVADAAHELRTPVAALSLLTDNLAKSATMQEMRERLLPLQEALARMRTLVAHLLDLARLQGELRAEATEVDLQQVVQEVISSLYPLAEAKAVDLGMTRNEPLKLHDIGGQLQVLIQNAVDNAIRYTPTGGTVDISLTAENNRAVVIVTDSGRGIPETELSQVFEPFYRVGGDTEPGNGLGLAICQEIARRLGGTITLANRAQGGLVFRYEQPVVMSIER